MWQVAGVSPESVGAWLEDRWGVGRIRVGGRVGASTTRASLQYGPIVRKGILRGTRIGILCSLQHRGRCHFERSFESEAKQGLGRKPNLGSFGPSLNAGSHSCANHGSDGGSLSAANDCTKNGTHARAPTNGFR